MPQRNGSSGSWGQQLWDIKETQIRGSDIAGGFTDCTTEADQTSVWGQPITAHALLQAKSPHEPLLLKHCYPLVQGYLESKPALDRVVMVTEQTGSLSLHLTGPRPFISRPTTYKDDSSKYTLKKDMTLIHINSGSQIKRIWAQGDW